MSKRDTLLLIADILDAAKKIIIYTLGIDYETVWLIKQDFLSEFIEHIKLLSEEK